MKKAFSSIMLTIAVLPALAGCGGYDYTAHLSESRSDLFCAETEEFSVTLSCITREYPYASDGITCPASDVVEISLVPVSATVYEYEVYVLGDKEWGGDMTFRTYASDFFYSQSVKEFPKESVTLKIIWENETREITATSVKNDKTISVQRALAYAVEAEKETISRMTVNGSFAGEFYVRLLRRNANYYYVGIIGTDGKTISLLLDSETGEVLARRE